MSVYPKSWELDKKVLEAYSKLSIEEKAKVAVDLSKGIPLNNPIAIAYEEECQRIAKELGHKI